MDIKVALLIIPLLSACAAQQDSERGNDQPPIIEATITVEPIAPANIPEASKALETVSRPALIKPEIVPANVVESTQQALIPLTSIVKAALPVAAGPQLVKKRAVAVINHGTVNGSVAFLTDSAVVAVPDGAIVTLTNLDAVTSITKPTMHSVDMKNKTYLPKAMVVNTGDTLVFKNNDPIKHNVFSSSGENTFDLGTYGFDTQREETINAKGVVKVYCNIHPEMALFIVANDSQFSMVTDESGDFSFSDVPAGNYLLDVWHVRGALDKKIVVTGNAALNEEIVIDTVRYTPKPHLNKYGEPYKKQPAILNDEFY
ncbi:MAG: plastocyanin [Porticoccus sp.]|jgi:plastocyanin